MGLRKSKVHSKTVPAVTKKDAYRLQSRRKQKFQQPENAVFSRLHNPLH